MTSDRQGIATVAPPTLEKRLEVLEAMRTLAAQEDERVRQRQDEIAAVRREVDALRRDCAVLAQTLPRICREQAVADVYAELRRYNPDQPRVPAGSPQGGEWTSEGGVQIAAGPGRPGYPIDLSEEEQRGGHTIAQHVGKSEGYLLSLVGDVEAAAQRHGDLAEGLREGSFPSLEAANKLVNSTIEQNQDTVDLVANGLLSYAELDADFSSPAGYEAFAKTERSTPYIRDTYGVHVVIVRDLSSPSGYLVLTAYPVNR